GLLAEPRLVPASVAEAEADRLELGAVENVQPERRIGEDAGLSRLGLHADGRAVREDRRVALNKLAIEREVLLLVGLIAVRGVELHANGVFVVVRAAY